MKHNITFSVIAAAALASCTQNEDFTSQYNENAKTMKFDVAYVGKNTRATGEMTTDALKNKNLIFWAAAYERQFDSQNPSTEISPKSEGIWITTQEPLYLKYNSLSTFWDVYTAVAEGNSTADVSYPGSSYRTYFTAIAPEDEFGTNKVTYSMSGQQKSNSTEKPNNSNSRKLTLGNIPVVQEVSTNATDYLIASESSTTEEVALTFKHLLSKLRFAVWTDESTANGTDPKTQIELNYVKIYLPNSTAKAQYVQKAHDKVEGDWTWSGFTSADKNPSTTETTGYQLVELTGSSQINTVVNYYNGPVAAHTAEWDKVKFGEDKSFYIAPNENTSSSTPAKLFIDIKYTVKRKVDGKWSTTNDESKRNTADEVYSAGHKEVIRSQMLVPFTDNNYGHNKTDSDKDPVDRNEGLSIFHQGVLETLYICLRADQIVEFSTSFDVNGWNGGLEGWVDDPIDVK